MLTAFKPYENMDEDELYRIEETLTITEGEFSCTLTPCQLPNIIKQYKTIANTEGKPKREYNGNPRNSKRSIELQNLYSELSKLPKKELQRRKKLVSTGGDTEYIIDLILSKSMKTKQGIPQIVKTSIEIVDYSEKSIALIGETKPHKEKLKVLYCKFNPFLTIRGKKQPGWIASKKHEAEIVEFINNL